MSEQNKTFEAPVIMTSEVILTDLTSTSGGWLSGKHAFDLPDLNNLPEGE